MAGSGMWVAQEALYSVLKNDATLQSLLGGSVGASRVFDEVPSNQDFPYGAFGAFAEEAEDTLGRSGKAIRGTFVVWSRYAGNKEAAQAIDRAAAILDGAALSITGYTNIRCVHVRSSVAPVDGVTRRGELEVKILAVQQ